MKMQFGVVQLCPVLAAMLAGDWSYGSDSLVVTCKLIVNLSWDSRNATAFKRLRVADNIARLRVAHLRDQQVDKACCYAIEKLYPTRKLFDASIHKVTKSDYIAANFKNNDKALYYGAGVLLYRHSRDCDGAIDILLGKCNAFGLSLLSGGSDCNAHTVADTACREFDEESGHLVSRDVIAQLQSRLDEPSAASSTTTSSPYGKGIFVIWVAVSRRALFFVDVDSIEGLYEETVDITDRYEKRLRAIEAGCVEASQDSTEHNHLLWMSLTDFDVSAHSYRGILCRLVETKVFRTEMLQVALAGEVLPPPPKKKKLSTTTPAETVSTVQSPETMKSTSEPEPLKPMNDSVNEGGGGGGDDGFVVVEYGNKKKGGKKGGQGKGGGKKR